MTLFYSDKIIFRNVKKRLTCSVLLTRKKSTDFTLYITYASHRADPQFILVS